MKKCSNGKGAYFQRFFCFLICTVFPIAAGGHSQRMVNQPDQNVGSVLFNTNDITKKCWNNEQLTLLISRDLFQDILPKTEMIDANNEDYIGVIMEYMDVCLEVIKKLSTGRTKRLIMRAFADTMAGYLWVYILPITKQSYYAGNIQYRNAKRLFDLYDDLKVFLRTDGIGWLKPNYHTQMVNITPINIPTKGNFDDCTNLLLYPGDEGGVLVPLPFLDDDESPGSIALPFENSSLHSLFAESSAFIVQKYYEASVSCILSSSRMKREISTEDQLTKFLKELNEWLKRVVYPHLEDDKWYPAFGGISRVIAGINAKNCSVQAMDPQIIHDIEDEMFGFNNSLAGDKSSNNVYFIWDSRNTIIMILSGVIILLVLGTFICNCKRHISNKKPISVVYKNAEFSSIKKNKFDPHYTACLCEEEYEDEEEDEEYLGDILFSSQEERRSSEERESRRFISVPTVQSEPIKCDVTAESPSFSSDSIDSLTVSESSP